MAPTRFKDMALEIFEPRPSKVENTIPEKNSGELRMTAVATLPHGVEGRPPILAIHQPRSRVTKRHAYDK